MTENALSGYSDSLQNELNTANSSVGLSINQCLNELAGTTNRTTADAANIWAGTTGLRTQDALNVKAFGVTDYALSTSGLVLGMTFNPSTVTGDAGSETIADLSGNENNGTNSGATYLSTGGRNGGGAFSFDGSNDIITITDSTTLELTTFTMSAWLKPISAGEADKGVVLQKDSTNGIYWFISNGRYTFYIGGDDLASNIDTGARISPTYNEWRHIVATFDSSNVLRMYEDGVLQVTSTALSNATFSTGDLTIGNREALDRTWDGSIDSPQIYNRALSADEIKKAYSSGLNLSKQDAVHILNTRS